jgi:hypothetical protein
MTTRIPIVAAGKTSDVAIIDIAEKGPSNDGSRPPQTILNYVVRCCFTFLTPHAELRPYVESFWVLESPNGLPATAKSIAAPNGCSKLIVPYENSVISVADGRVQTSWALRMYFVGNRDSATLIRSSAHKTGFIAIEFRPHNLSDRSDLYHRPMDSAATILFNSSRERVGS